jgi:hypothetical protein
MVAGGFVPVERDRREASMVSIGRARPNRFAPATPSDLPGGTRSRSAELLPFKKAASSWRSRRRRRLCRWPYRAAGGVAKGQLDHAPGDGRREDRDPVETKGCRSTIAIAHRDRAREDRRA